MTSKKNLFESSNIFLEISAFDYVLIRSNVKVALHRRFTYREPTLDCTLRRMNIEKPREIDNATFVEIARKLSFQMHSAVSESESQRIIARLSDHRAI